MPPQLPQPADPSRIGACRILIVDDNYDAAHTLARLLTAMGVAAREAHSGAEAIAAMEQELPDLVFLDLGMAGMDGLETARQIKARFPQVPIPLIAITGLGLETDRQQTREAGFAAHLVKPVNFELLEKTLAEFLPSSGAVG
jgi:CheY-like chemotaxis protein